MSEGVRIDKWLWAARFFKTRSLATDAINAGHVRRAKVDGMEGERIKPATQVHMGDLFCIQKDESAFTVKVTVLDDRRGSAALAAALYQETAESVSIRLKAKAERAAERQSEPLMKGRPTKQDRRALSELFADTYRSDSFHDAS